MVISPIIHLWFSVSSFFLFFSDMSFEGVFYACEGTKFGLLFQISCDNTFFNYTLAVGFVAGCKKVVDRDIFFGGFDMVLRQKKFHPFCYRGTAVD